MRHSLRLLTIPALLLHLASAGAQQLDREPAASAVPPRSELPGDRAGPPSEPRTGAPAQQAEPRPPVGVGTPPQQPPSTEPPAGHRTMPAPEVPGQRLPESSSGAGNLGQSPIPDRARPDRR
ncbi:hypothetical protein ACVFYP_18995 [Roseomonas sp. F4]